MFKEGAVTCSTVVALAMNEDTDTLCSDRLIHDQLLSYPMLVKQPTSTMGTTKRRSDQLRLDSEVMLSLVNAENTIVHQAQEVQGHLSQRVLPDESYTR